MSVRRGMAMDGTSRPGRTTERPAAAGRSVRLALATTIALLFGGCEEVVVSKAPIAFLELSPDSVTLLEGESARLSATASETGGRTVEAPEVAWSSDDPDVASVSDAGLVEGLARGVTRVRAVAEGVEGTARVEVFTGPLIGLAETGIFLSVVAGLREAIEVDIEVFNDGDMELSSLEAAAEMDQGSEARWLAGRLLRSVAPTTLRVSLRPESLPVGEYRGRILVAAPSASNSPRAVRVDLEVLERPWDSNTVEEGDPEENNDDKGGKGGKGGKGKGGKGDDAAPPG